MALLSRNSKKHTVTLFHLNELDALERETDSTSKDLLRRNAKLIKALKDRGPERQYQLHSAAASDLEALQWQMPNFADVIDDVLDGLALTDNQQPLKLQPLLLTGGPGVGKSYFCNQFANVLGLPTHRLAMESSQNSSQLSGSDAHWNNTDTGLVFKSLALGEHISPVILLDEIDKAPQQSQYDPLSSLYGILEPETAQYFQDESFPLTLDARYVIWIATANDLSKLDAPLLDRFSVHEIKEPDADQGQRIAESIAAKVMQQYPRVQELGIQIDPEIYHRLATYTPRNQHKVFTKILGTAIRKEQNTLTVDLLDKQNHGTTQAPFGFVQMK